MPLVSGAGEQGVERLDGVIRQSTRGGPHPLGEGESYSHGKVILTQAFGTMRQGSGDPLTAQSVFHLGVGYQAVPVMQLVDREKSTSKRR